MSYPRLAPVVAILSLTLSACSGPAPTDQARSSSPTAPAITPQNARIQEIQSAGRFHEEAWRFSLTDLSQEPTQERFVQIEESLLVIQDQKNMVHAMSLGTGTHHWVVQLDEPMTELAGVGTSTVCFISGDSLVSVHRASGSRVIGRVSLNLDFWPSSRGVTAAGNQFVGRAAPFGVQAVASDAGFSGWLYDTRAPVIDLLVEGDGQLAQVIGLTSDGLVFSLKPWHASGKAPPHENWQRRLPSAYVSIPLCRNGNSLLIASEDTFLYCMDIHTGQIRWKFPCGSSLSADTHCNVHAAGNSAYLRAQDTLYSIDLETGAEQWNFKEGTRCITRIGNLCYIETSEGNVSVRECKTGKDASSFSVADYAHVPSIPGGGIFVAGDGNGNFFALR